MSLPLEILHGYVFNNMHYTELERGNSRGRACIFTNQQFLLGIWPIKEGLPTIKNVPSRWYGFPPLPHTLLQLKVCLQQGTADIVEYLRHFQRKKKRLSVFT